jgi:hypothetical protein
VGLALARLDLVPIEKARRESLDAVQRRIDAAAKPYAAALAAWLRKLARIEAERAILNPHAYAAGRAGIAKARAPSESELRGELERLLRMFGLRAAGDAANRTAGEVVIPASLYRDAVASKDVRIQWFWQLEAEMVRKVDDVLESTKQAARDSVKRILIAASKEKTQPSTGEIARRIRTAFSGPGDTERPHRVHATEGDRAFAFSSERAALIARTETVQAENTGIFGGYVATGVEEVEWLAYSDGKSGNRHHERMKGERVRVGEYFTLPSGAKLRYPGDPMGPIGETAACRCTLRAVRTKGAKPKAAPAPAPRAPSGEDYARSIDALASRRSTAPGDEIRSENILGVDPAKLTREQRDVLEAVTVYSAGNVGAVRDPTRFDPAKASAPIPGPRFRWPGGDTVYRVEPTREAYENAHRVFRALATRPARDRSTLYRGMHLPPAAARALTPGAEFDTGAIASWSTARDIAVDFTWDGAKKGELGVVMRMVPRHGSRIDALSRYADEAEFISSGRVRVVRVQETDEYILVDVEPLPLDPVAKRRAGEPEAPAEAPPELDAEARAALLAAFGRRQVRRAAR